MGKDGKKKVSADAQLIDELQRRIEVLSKWYESFYFKKIFFK